MSALTNQVKYAYERVVGYGCSTNIKYKDVIDSLVADGTIDIVELTVTE